MKTYSRVYANVNLDAIRENVRTIETIMKDDTKIIAVLKADGYGHGALPIAEELETMDRVFGYGLATKRTRKTENQIRKCNFRSSS